MAAAFAIAFKKAEEEVFKTYKHCLSSALILELEGLNPDAGGTTSDDACLRAWKKIEKVIL